VCIGRRERAELLDIPLFVLRTGDGDAEDLGTQAGPAASRAGLAGEVGLQAVLLELALRGLHLPLPHGNKSLERLDRGGLSLAASCRQEFLPVGAVPKLPFEILGQVSERNVGRRSRGLAKGLHHRPVVLTPPLVGGPPGTDRSFLHRFQREILIDNKARITEGLRPESLAGGTGARMTVEGKMAGGQPGHREAGFWVAEIGGKSPLLPGIGRGSRLLE